MGQSFVNSMAPVDVPLAAPALLATSVAQAPIGGIPGLDPLTPTVFHTPWWLEAATGGNYDQVQVRSGGRVVGRLPFMLNTYTFGLRLCAAPRLCHSLGPAVDAGPGNLTTRQNNRHAIMRDLIGKLPKCSSYYMPLHAGVTDTFAFSEAQWRTTVQFTFVVHPLGEAVLWRAMRDKTRNVLRRAAERYQVETLCDAAEYERLYKANLRARKMHNYYDRIEPVCTAALEHGRGRILAVRGPGGAVLAAIVVVWDERAMYYLLTTRSPDADNSIVSLLVWHAIKMANAKSLLFDFDNVGTVGSRLFFSGFGGEIEPRYLVERSTAPAYVGRWMRGTAREARRLLPSGPGRA